MKLPFYLENERIRIYTDDGVVVKAAYYRADDQNTPVIAEAKCSPHDKFDFIVGAKLAMERLLTNLKWQPYLKYTQVNSRGTEQSVDIGKIGIPLNCVDKNGAPLFIGDVVCYTNFNRKEFSPITLSHDRMPVIYDGLGFSYVLVKTKDCEKLIDYRDMLKDGMSVRVGKNGVIEYVTIMRE